MLMISKKIVIVGTHATPALALIEALKKREEWQIYYLGRRYTFEGKKIPSTESQIFPKHNIPFIAISSGRLQRKFTCWTIPSLLKIPFSVLVSLYFLMKIKPNVVCSFGGYSSVPVIISAWLLGIPSITHEQTTVAGLSNKINSLFVNKVAITFPQSAKFFPPQKTILTGNPIRQSIFQTNHPLYNFPKKQPLIYITGGNQGAQIINQNVRKILPQLLSQYNIIHQCGQNNYQELKKQAEKLPTALKKNYFLVPYVNDQSIGWALSADLVIGRSGANTVLELAALGKPAILIPIPWSAHNEQTINGRFLVKNGGAIILPQKKLNPSSLMKNIKKVINNLNSYQKKAKKLQKHIKLDAAATLIKEIYRLL